LKNTGFTSKPGTGFTVHERDYSSSIEVFAVINVFLTILATADVILQIPLPTMQTSLAYMF
jgi:hypothetical protein